MKGQRVHFDCPSCGKRVTGDLSPGYPGSHLDPPEPPALDRVEGCPHADAWDGSDPEMEEAALREADEADQASADAEVERRIDARREAHWEEGGEA